MLNPSNKNGGRNTRYAGSTPASSTSPVGDSSSTGRFLLPWWGGEVLRRQRLPVITLRVRARQQALARGVHPVFQAPRAAAVASAGCIESAALAVGPPASAGHVSSKVTSDNTSYARRLRFGLVTPPPRTSPAPLPCHLCRHLSNKVRAVDPRFPNVHHVIGSTPLSAIPYRDALVQQ